MEALRDAFAAPRQMSADVALLHDSVEGLERILAPDTAAADGEIRRMARAALDAGIAEARRLEEINKDRQDWPSREMVAQYLKRAENIGSGDE